MTKQQWLANLSGRAEILSVGTATMADSPGEANLLPDVTWYYVPVLEVEGDSAYRRNVRFYVYKEGEGEEAAYDFKKPDTQALTSRAVRDAIESYASGVPNVIGWTYNQYNEEQKWADINVICDAGPYSGVWTRFLIYRDNGSTTHMPISGDL